MTRNDTHGECVGNVWIARHGAVSQLVWRLMGTLLLLVTPSPAYADFAQICAPIPFKGAVKRVVLLQAPTDVNSARPRREPKVLHVTDITADGRIATEVETFNEVPSLADRAKNLTKIRQYDAAGRMINEVLNTRGSSLDATTSCEYDNQGRLTRATVASRNRIANQTYEYTYGPSSRSERAIFSAAVILTTVTLDEQGRPVIEKRYDEFMRLQRAITEFRYLAEGTETCTQAFDEPRRCRLSIYDTHGNMVEERSERGVTRIAYEYDTAGNWTRRITSEPGITSLGIWRKFSYW